MHRPRALKPLRSLAMVVVLAAGFVTAALLGVAVAKTFTLQVGKNVQVGAKRENVVVTSHGAAVYTLTGDSKQHPKCTMSCFQFWPPVKVSSAKSLSKAPGIKGTLGVWRRNGFTQVTLNGHPLYRYSGDSGRGRANGEGIMSFGGTWHVIKVAGSAGGTGGGTSSTSSATTTSTTATTGCVYPPCTGSPD